MSALQALTRSMGTAPGQIGRYVFQMDANPGELWLVGLFESKEAYWANARSPEQPSAIWSCARCSPATRNGTTAKS